MIHYRVVLLSLYVIFHFFNNNFLIIKVVVVTIRQDDINNTYLLFAIVINVIGMMEIRHCYREIIKYKNIQHYPIHHILFLTNLRTCLQKVLYNSSLPNIEVLSVDIIAFLRTSWEPRSIIISLKRTNIKS